MEQTYNNIENNDFTIKTKSTEENRIHHNEMNIRKMKKQELIKLSQKYGFKFNKKTTNRSTIIVFLLENQRRTCLYQNILKKMEDCPICLNVLDETNSIITSCIHAFCKNCIFSYITTEKEVCPLCRKLYTCETMMKQLNEIELQEFLNILTSKKQNHTVIYPITHTNNESSIHPDILQVHPYMFSYFLNIMIIKRIYNVCLKFIKYFFAYKSLQFLYELITDKSIIDNHSYNTFTNIEDQYLKRYDNFTYM